MADLLRFTFNVFEENTYVIYDATGECVIVDPGCNTPAEQQELVRAISARQLRPVQLINTHCHLDHIFGNHFVAQHYGLGLAAHRLELPVLKAAPQVCLMYGLPACDPSPVPTVWLEDGETFTFGETTLQLLFTPGHSPGSVCLYHAPDHWIVAGDVLFQRSIGRTDLPGGDHATLIGSIMTKLMPLPDDTVVHPGHGPATTIGEERRANPFL